MSPASGKALVSGGAGFIGSALVERLIAEGYEVDVIDDLSTGRLANLAAARDAGGVLRIHETDICSPDLIKLVEHQQPELIFHLAAQCSVEVSLKDPALDAQRNVLGSLQVLEGARAAKARKVVFAVPATSLYGEVELHELPLSEGAPRRLGSPHAVSKKTVLDYLAAYRELYGIEYTALVLSSVYGPRQLNRREPRVVASFVDRLVRAATPTIHGDGEQVRDFLFIDDAVDAFVRAAHRGDGLVLNIGTGVGMTINELHRVLTNLVGISGPARHSAVRAGDIRFNALDASEAKLHLGWQPSTSLEGGLLQVLEWQIAQLLVETTSP